jgi:hypothetical protein
MMMMIANVLTPTDFSPKNPIQRSDMFIIIIIGYELSKLTAYVAHLFTVHVVTVHQQLHQAVRSNH